MTDVATVHRESERNYDLEDGVALPDPAGLLGQASEPIQTEERVEAVYFDTSGLALLRAGVTFRRGEGGHDEGWHLKLPAGPDSRDEVRLPLTHRRRTPPAELVELARVHARGGELAPVALLDIRRRRWMFADDAGHAMVELVEDEVHAHSLGRQTRALSWREVEIELGEHGQLGLLDRIERALLEAGARRSSTSSKLARLLADRLSSVESGERAGAKGPRAAKLAKGSAGEAVLNYLGVQVDRIRRYDPLVRQDAPDAVHQMRVAARRMRASLRAYRRILDGAATRELVDELRWLGRQLADARDSEVLAERLVGSVQALPDDLVLGPVHTQLTRGMERRRADGREVALATLDSDRYLRLHESIDQLLESPPLTKRGRRPARRELARHVSREGRRTAKRMTAVDGLDGDDRDRALHETRKAAKRLRYAVEVAIPSGGKPAKRLRKAIKELNTMLGIHQDTVLARPVLRELAAQAHLEGGNGFTHGVLYGQELSRAERTRSELTGLWKRLAKRKRYVALA